MPHLPLRSVLLALSMTIFLLGFASPGASAPSSVGNCPLAPLTLPLFGATPSAIVAATPVASSPDEAVEEAAIGQAVEEIVACINSGDPAFQYAIFTERYLAEQFADPAVAYQPRFEFELTMGPGDGEGSFELVGVTAVTPLEGGLASVTIELSAGNAIYRDTLVLANVDGVWLIDAIGELDPVP